MRREIVDVHLAAEGFDVKSFADRFMPVVVEPKVFVLSLYPS